MRSDLLIGIASVAAAIGILSAAALSSEARIDHSAGRMAPEIQDIDTWLNSEPLKLQELRGKGCARRLLDLYLYQLP
jgi:hypothetical protein